MSHLLQMRGLKRKTLEGYRAIRESHLLQMRGLKLDLTARLTGKEMSHLLQMRGLKRHLERYCRQAIVASFTDAWIETT